MSSVPTLRPTRTSSDTAMRVPLLVALLGVVVAALAVPTNPQPQQRIVGGSPTYVEKYPFMANMMYAVYGILWYQTCGGSLINNRVIVSAAHCYEYDTASVWRAFLGTSHVAGVGGTEYQVERIIMHPQYSRYTLNNDVAVLWLSSTVTFTDSIQPVRIAGPDYYPPDNALVTTIGWGALMVGGDFPVQLQEVDLNVIKQEVCAERYKHLQTQPGYQNWPDISDNMVCAGILDVGGKDACQRDSGGPLLHQGDILVGIVSWGFECAHPTYPGVNARVSAFSDWIVENAS